MSTLGEKRVRVNFNPENVGNVNAIKEKTAQLINILEEYKDKHSLDSESFRLISIAQTSFEEAAMWGVKAVTSLP